jgi:predicted kinase
MVQHGLSSMNIRSGEAIMGPTPGLIDAIYRGKVLRARATPIGEKVHSGAELFEMVCRRMRDGLRSENPGADDATIETLLRQRLDRLRKLREYDDRRSGRLRSH